MKILEIQTFISQRFCGLLNDKRNNYTVSICILEQGLRPL